MNDDIEKSFVERRDWPRTIIDKIIDEARLSLTSHPQENSPPAEVVNISASGAGVLMPMRLEKGAQVKLQILGKDIPELDLDAYGIVVPDDGVFPEQGVHYRPGQFNPQLDEMLVTRYRLPLAHKLVRANNIDKVTLDSQQRRVAMAEAGLEPVWVHGRRYTDQRTLAIAEHTLVHKVNKPICDMLNELGCQTMALHSLSSCVLFAEPLKLKSNDGRTLDLGLVGKVNKINAELLITLCETGTIPVIAPVACDRTGEKLNVNADNAAGKVAAAVKAEKIVFVSDTHGILSDRNNPASTISSLSEAEIEEMVKIGTITEGMMPKVGACIAALDGGAKKAHVIDGRIPHSLLLEIYTDKGIGTQIIK